MQQPGVGPVTALLFVLTIGPIERFQRSKQVVSYLGLNPRESSSGGRQRLGAISKQGNSLARFLLVEAAQTASRYDGGLRRDYQRLKFRRARQCGGGESCHRTKVGGAAVLEITRVQQPSAVDSHPG